MRRSVDSRRGWRATLLAGAVLLAWLAPGRPSAMVVRMSSSRRAPGSVVFND